MHPNRRIVAALAAATLAGGGLAACGTEDAEREAREAVEDAERKGNEALDDAKKKADDIKRDAERETQGEGGGY